MRISLLAAALAGFIVLGVAGTLVARCGRGVTERPADAAATNGVRASGALEAQGEAVANLSAYAQEDSIDPLVPATLLQSRALLAERGRAEQAQDVSSVARLNAVLASEAFQRAARLTTRWLDYRDQAVGLFPKDLSLDGRVWTYGDAGADLFPFVTIATRMLVTDRYPEVLATLSAERTLSPGLPRDIDLRTAAPIPQDDEEELLGAVEYAKDGLLPLVEMLGPDPWLGRLIEVTDQIVIRASTPTSRGPIPSNSTEINGGMLQVLARLHWASGDPRYRALGDRIAAAYLQDMLPTTEHVPAHRWSFIENDPIGPRRFFLGDHGAEIVSGLVEWHRVEVAANAPNVERHRAAIRKLLDRLLVKGRATNGLWHSQIDVPSGKVRDKDLTDNWGYLGQAYLHQSAIERSLPAGERALADHLEAQVAAMLRGAAGVRYYAWQEGEMDGYADALEGAIYLLRYLDVPEAADWLHEQMAVLYGFQHDDGRVTDDNIDGNFLRTTLLYGMAMTQGARVEPWSESVAIGAVRDGACVHVHLHAAAPWTGWVMFDSMRHREHLRMPADYPRLNQWPEWFSMEPDGAYAVTDEQGARTMRVGRELIAGLPISLEPDRAYALRVCPR